MKPVDPRVLPHLRPARWALAGVVAGSTAGGLLLVAQAFALARLVTAAVGGEDLTGPGAWVLATFAARAATGWLTDRAAARAAGQVGTALRGRLSEAALALGGGPSRHRTGELTVLLTRGVAAVEPYLTRYLPALVVAVVLPPATLLAMAWVDWPAALTAAVTLPLIPVFAVLVGLATRDRADRQWRLLSSLSGHFVDLVRGLPTLVAYNRAALQGDRIRVVTARYRDATLATLKVAFASSAVLELVATLSVALVAVLVGLRLATGGLDLETALVVLLLAPEAYWPLRRVGAEFHAAAEGTATFEAADALLREAPVAVPRDGDAMAVEDLVVRYPDRDVPALDGVSATFPSRGLTAVTGPSGCGKSTLLAVLLGRLSPTAGTVTTPAADRIAWVPQRPWLMPASVRDNVRLGRPDATDAEVWAALEQVRLAHHVATLPGGLDTVLAEDGASFSAGERARLALARVVVSDRPWVLLDEPTAHLDEETEQVVAETLVRLAVDRAVVVVAHRPSLVALADHVVALPAPASAPAPEHGPIATRPSAATPVSTPAIKGSPEPAASPRRRLALATLLGALAAASGVALTATAGWLIVRAAEQPPVLMLILAIVGVRTFGIARPVLRYAERLVGHAAALRMLAEERARVYDDLVPLVPGRLGPHRGDLLARVVDDVDAVLDEQLRVRLPVLTGSLVVAGATVFTALVSPVAVLPVLGSALVGGAAALGLSWWTARRAEAAFVRERGALSALVGSVLDGAPDLVAWQAGSPEQPDEPPAALLSAAQWRRWLRGSAWSRSCTSRPARRPARCSPCSACSRLRSWTCCCRSPTPASSRSAPGPRASAWPRSPAPSLRSPTRPSRSPRVPAATWPSNACTRAGARRRCCATSAWVSPRAHGWPSSVPPARASRRSSRCCSGSSTRSAAAWRWTAAGWTGSRSPTYARGSGWSTTTRTCSPRRCARTSVSPCPALTTPSSSRRWTGPGSRRGSHSFRRASTRSSATGTRTSLAASAPASESRGRCSATAACWCWTSRPRTSTRAPPRRSPRTCSGRVRTGGRWCG